MDMDTKPRDMEHALQVAEEAIAHANEVRDGLDERPKAGWRDEFACQILRKARALLS